MIQTKSDFHLKIFLVFDDWGTSKIRRHVRKILFVFAYTSTVD